MWQYMSKYKTEGLKTTAIKKYMYIQTILIRWLFMASRLSLVRFSFRAANSYKCREKIYVELRQQ